MQIRNAIQVRSAIESGPIAVLASVAGIPLDAIPDLRPGCIDSFTVRPDPTPTGTQQVPRFRFIVQRRFHTCEYERNYH